jgi:hypothetical protein
MRQLAPRVPRNLHPLAKEILDELRSRPEAEKIILGGGVALQHYLEFRGTVDLDAWWGEDVSPETEELVREAMENVGGRHGFELGTRAWRETRSYELKKGSKNGTRETTASGCERVPR